jgi:hypothetical protein
VEISVTVIAFYVAEEIDTWRFLLTDSTLSKLVNVVFVCMRIEGDCYGAQGMVCRIGDGDCDS